MSEVDREEPAKQKIQKQQSTWQEEVEHLTAVVANDCKLKKDKKIRYAQHKKRASELWQQKREQASERDHMLLAGLYKNLGKMGDSEDCLEKALVLIKKGKGPTGRIIKWMLQLIAHKSSLKKHSDCFKLAQTVIKDVKNMLEAKLQDNKYSKEHELIRLVLRVSEQSIKDEIIWKHNDKAIEQALLQKLRKQNQDVFIPFFSKAEFHIADIMTLEVCKEGWMDKADCDLQDLVTFLSIGFFTMATETYYMEDYSHKHEHIRSIKIALIAFDLRCTYVVFLLKILRDHFEQKMTQIPEERLINGQHNELMRIIPKELKEISLASLSLPE